MEAGYEIKSIRFFERKLYSSTEIREKMVRGENWEKLVPKSVVAFIRKIDGVDRLRDLNKSDRA
jgi:nicotinamide-nucleotide adenylyltransferase